ncbi:MAG: hypothetical protein LBE13_19930, partial [Bacteroidales bacterium]|nr:hypothetical protein [Bacteroidales bacterium]
MRIWYSKYQKRETTMTIFKTYCDSIFIKDHLICKHIIAGDYSYYSSYYHEHSFVYDFNECDKYFDFA